MFKIVDKLPTEGQFISVFEFEGVIWSDTFMYGETGLYKYDEGWDDWHPVSSVNDGYEYPRKLSFIITEE